MKNAREFMTAHLWYQGARGGINLRHRLIYRNNKYTAQIIIIYIYIIYDVAFARTLTRSLKIRNN